MQTIWVNDLHINDSSLCTLKYVSMNKSALNILYLLQYLRSSVCSCLWVTLGCNNTTKCIPTKLRESEWWQKTGLGPGHHLFYGGNLCLCKPRLKFFHALEYLLMYFPHQSHWTNPHQFCAGGKCAACVSPASFPFSFLTWKN